MYVRVRACVRAYQRFWSLSHPTLTRGGHHHAQLGEYSSRAGNLLWRSVYLVKQVSTRNRILVLLDWWKTRFFGRDISRF